MFAATKSGSSRTATDPQFNYVTMLLHGDGTNGAQNNTFLDSSTNNFTITRNGNTTQGTFTPYGSNWSNYFDGTGDYITSSQSQTIPATGDFTIDGWFWCNTYTNYPSILSQGTSGNAGRFNIYINNDGKFGVQIGATVNNIGSAVSTNQWVYFAVTRSGSTVTVYINGASIGTATNGTSIQNTTPSIGSEWTGDPYRWIGYLSNIRVSNVVRTISLPSSPFVADANTVLLACQSNRFIDTSTTAATLTPNGNVSVQRFSPFAPAVVYAPATNGGSAYFANNSTNYLQTASNAAFALGTGNWTVEGWIYLNNNSASNYGSIISTLQGSYGLFLGVDSGKAMVATGNASRADYVYGPSVLPSKTWIHLAATNNGGTFTLYINGVASGTGSNSYSLGSTTAVLGAYYVNNSPIYPLQDAYISNARLVSGVLVYTGSFTPPTAPIATSGAASAASYPSTTNVNTSFAASSTLLLCNFTNGGIIDNAMMNDLETVGNAQISTSVVKYGTGSLYFDGNGDYLQGPSTPQFDFGAGDFTIEMWAYPTAVGQANLTLLYAKPNGSGYSGVIVGQAISGYGVVIYASSTGSSWNLASGVSAGTMNANAWNHIAVVRSGTNLYGFVNGVLGSTTSVSTTALVSTTGNISIGSSLGTASTYFTGYIDDLRITKGYARYTANFTPPTAAFPNQ